MKHVDIEQFVNTRTQRLERWAELVYMSPSPLVMLHGLEHMHPQDLRHLRLGNMPRPNAFAVAVADPVFRLAGLVGNTMGEVMDFFQLTQAHLHTFGCDCGGPLDQADMAARIKALTD